MVRRPTCWPEQSLRPATRVPAQSPSAPSAPGVGAQWVREDAPFAGPDARPQWLCGICRVDSLRRRLAGLGDPAGASMKALVGGLRLARHPVAPAVIGDIDTAADARSAGIDL
ncbi:hypothetical protein [Gryllotalpicola protaetiae]|uniref:hypothetical protein n=1 Tax=Gryllotalpicola protaetiae TaxID=2419771 RepID=UPI0013C4A257|nr:hypothetical protein [Gryllotalpicola protaetiae]